MSAHTGDTHNIQGTTDQRAGDQDAAQTAGTASGGSQPDTRDGHSLPVDNPSGG